MEGVLRLGADHRPSTRHRTLTINERKYVLKWTRLSCRRFRDNQARFPLFALASNLANFLCELALPRPVHTRTLTKLRETLIKIGAKVVRPAKAIMFPAAVARAFFAARLGRIGRLRSAPSARVIVHCKRKRVASSRGGLRRSAVRSGRRAEERVKRGRQGV
jgi:hypothetical protein